MLRWKASTIAGVSEAGLLVASVADQSASGNDGTISASGVRYYGTAMGGNPSMGQTSPAAAGKILATSNTSYSKVTMFMATKYIAAHTGGDTTYNSLGGKEGAYGLYINNSTGGLVLSTNSTNVERGSGMTSTSAVRRVCARVDSGTSNGTDLLIDGVRQGSAFTFTIRDQLVKFSLFDIAGYAAISYIPEFFVFDKILNDSEVAQVDAYLLAEYGT